MRKFWRWRWPLVWRRTAEKKIGTLQRDLAAWQVRCATLLSMRRHEREVLRELQKRAVPRKAKRK